MLFFLTLLITFPSLYVFNALVGCRLAFMAVLRLLIASLGVALAVLASFGTIVFFFSLCSSSYPFMVLLNVLLFAIAGVLGMHFLLQTLGRLSAVGAGAFPEQVPQATLDDAPAPVYPDRFPAVRPPPIPSPAALGPHVRTIFAIWVIVFGLIGSQMGWVLRPFIGSPDAPVTFFRAREGNFFSAVADRIEDLVGQWQAPARTAPAPMTQPARNSSRQG
jgi:hypothetical protein